MSKFSDKIRVLINNNGWTQSKLADILSVQPTTVQKWCSGINTPSVDTVVELCHIFNVSANDLLDDEVEIPEYVAIDKYLPYSLLRNREDMRDSEHDIIDAMLADGALLHRFRNCAGCECSAIYVGSVERWWHYREYEAKLIREWNEVYGYHDR